MAINLSSGYNAPWAVARKTLHATAGNLDVLTLPSWCKFLEIVAVGTGDVRFTHTGSQDAAIGIDFMPISNGGSYKLNSTQLSGYQIRITGTVNADYVVFIMKAEWEG